MNRSIKFILGNSTFNFLSKSMTADRIGYGLILSLKKRNGLSISDACSINKMDLKTCPFCLKPAFFEPEFEMEEGDIIKVKNIIYPDYLYCHGGRKSDCPGSKLNPNSILFISKTRNVSEEEALKIIHKRNKSPFYSENHVNDNKYKKAQTRDLDFYINLYGIIDGKLAWDKYKKKLCNSLNKYSQIKKHGLSRYLEINKSKDSMSLNHFMEKYGSDNDLNLVLNYYEQRKKNVKNDKSSLIEKYGKEEGTQKYESYINKKKIVNSIEYYISKYGKVEGREKYNDWRSKIACTPEKFKIKYGEIEGAKRYKKWLTGITKTGLRYSKESILFFEKCLSKLNLVSETGIFYGKKEYFLYDKKCNTIYFYDFCILEKKIIVEYDGAYWHPLSVEENTNKKIDPVFVISRDKRKEELAIEKGFTIFRVRSDEPNKEEKFLNIFK